MIKINSMVQVIRDGYIGRFDRIDCYDDATVLVVGDRRIQVPANKIYSEIIKAAAHGA